MAAALGACSESDTGEMVDFAAAETEEATEPETEYALADEADEYSPAEETESEVELYGVVFSAADEYWYAVKNVNIRTEPNTDCEVVGVLNKGNELEVTGISEEWLMVIYENQTCFASAGYMERVEEAEETEYEQTQAQ